MAFTLGFTDEASLQLRALEASADQAKRLKAVRKALGRLEQTPRHPGLQTHEYRSLKGANGEKVFEAYAEQNTPGAFRIFWHYGPAPHTITIVAIVRHP